MTEVSTTPPVPRYAIYYAPHPDSALARLGARWLGRDGVNGCAIAHAPFAAISTEEIARITVDPRRYGFHGTLKAPFRLAKDRSEAELVEQVGAFASARRRFMTAPLRLADIAGFLALVPSQPSTALHELAGDCVRAFDDFRAPPTASELAKRRASKLSPAQDLLLERWGYPYVMEEFRFHLTLTEKLPSEQRTKIKDVLAPLVEPFTQEPFIVDGVTLFVEPAPGEPFTILRRFPFAGA